MLRRTLENVLRRTSSFSATMSASPSCALSSFTSPMVSTPLGGFRGRFERRFASSSSIVRAPRPQTMIKTLSPPPRTPGAAQHRGYATSQKVKMSKTRTKIKGYSSWKGRFSVTASGLFRRKQKGKRHMGFSKTPKQRRQLRGTKLVDKTLEQPMRKLGFSMV